MKFEPQATQYVAVYGYGRKLMQETTKKDALAEVERDEGILRIIEVKETAVFTREGYSK